LTDSGSETIVVTQMTNTSTTIVDIQEELIRVYPTITVDNLFVDCAICSNDLTFEIINVQGYSVYKGNLKVKNTIDISSFSSGTYFVKINNLTFAFQKR
jgi:hypothetical protein